MLLNRPYPVPENEIARLEELRSYRVLDSIAECVFDDVVNLARHVFHTEYSMIALIDDARQWFKAKVGTALVETPREEAFCTHTILANAVMVVPDATLDSRFADNPLVTGAPHIRFYAGAPMTTPGGHNIGTVCVFGRTPRDDFSNRDCRHLESLADIAMSELNKRVATNARRRHNRHLSTLNGVVSGYGVKPTMVDILNISARGAMVRYDGPALPKGAELILTIGKLVVVATVAWAKDEMDGLDFQIPIGPVELAKLTRHIERGPSH